MVDRALLVGEMLMRADPEVSGSRRGLLGMRLRSVSNEGLPGMHDAEVRGGDEGMPHVFSKEPGGVPFGVYAMRRRVVGGVTTLSARDPAGSVRIVGSAPAGIWPVLRRAIPAGKRLWLRSSVFSWPPTRREEVRVWDFAAGREHL